MSAFVVGDADVLGTGLTETGITPTARGQERGHVCVGQRLGKEIPLRILTPEDAEDRQVFGRFQATLSIECGETHHKRFAGEAKPV